MTGLAEKGLGGFFPLLFVCKTISTGSASPEQVFEGTGDVVCDGELLQSFICTMESNVCFQISLSDWLLNTSL